MRDLNKHTGRAAATRLPKGLAFAIDDLVMATEWATRNAVRMMVRLDHGSAGEEYEEALALYPEIDPTCGIIVWRNETAVFVQPPLGRRSRHRSVAAALGSLTPSVALTDITATAWPAA